MGSSGALQTRDKKILKAAIQRLINDFPFHGYTDRKEDAYFNVASTVMRYLPVGSKILDFGCGPCDKTVIIQFLGYDCSGYDELLDEWHKLDGNRKKILNFASAHDIDLHIGTGGDLPFDKGLFDMVMMHDVLEHLHNSPRDLLNDLLELVKPGGYFFTTVPSAVNIRKRISVLFGNTNLPHFEGYYWNPGPWRGHVREYTKLDLILLADYLDLEILELRSCNHMLEKISPILRNPYIWITNIFSGFRDSWLLVARKKQNWAPKRELPREDLNRILSRGTTYRYDL